MKQINVAIDGPSGAGKSTIARAAARDLGLLYVDTGAIYRSIGYYLLRHGVDPRDKDRVLPLLPGIRVELRYEEDGLQHMILNGTDVTDELRTPQMSDYASKISVMKPVRAYLLDLQREMARKNNVVMDGRDIGTVVLPNADVKIFLTADVKVRARRRLAELEAKGEKTTFAEVLADMEQRDERDSTRAIAPLRCAPDAVRVDTSDCDIDESVRRILAVVEDKLAL